MRSVYKNTAEKYPQIMKLEFLGKSFEGRKLELVKISKNPEANNPIIFIDAGEILHLKNFLFLEYSLRLRMHRWFTRTLPLYIRH